MTQDVRTRLESLLDSLKDDKSLSAAEKSYLASLLNETAENTNGRSTEQKIQGLSTAVFHLTSLWVMDKLDGQSSKLGLLARTLDSCKWALCVLAGIVSTLLIFQPQVAQIVAEILKR